MDPTEITSDVDLDQFFVRHDNDDRNPRTLSEIYDLNRAVAARMDEVFVQRGVQVVPTIGVFHSYHPTGINENND